MANENSIFYKLGEAVKAQIAAANGASGEVQSELDITQTGAGLSATGAYVANEGTNYLTAASSLKAADEALDSELKSANNAIATKASQTDLNSTNTNVSTISSSLSTAESNITSLDNNKANLSGATFTGAVSGTSLSLSNDLTVTGNLEVLGATTQTKITEQNLDIKDNFIGLNRGASASATNAKDIGLYFERGSSESAGAIVFDETNDKFVVGFLQDTAGAGSVLEVTFPNAEIGAELATGDLTYSFDLTGHAATIIEANPNIIVSGLGPDMSFNHDDGASSTLGGPLSGNSVHLEFDIVSVDGNSNYGQLTVAQYVAYLAMTQEEKDTNYPGYTITPELYFSAGNSVVFNSADTFAVSSSTTGFAKASPFVEATVAFDQFASQMMVATTPAASHNGGAGTPAADASAATAAATAAPLQVGSLEIGSELLGDLADFEAALAGS